MMSLAVGAYFFLIALVLAHLEIQIEGPHGWAEKLPTWRWDSRAVRRWFGKPVTGYHVCLGTLILLFLHVPQLYGGSWVREADLLSIFFLLTATWIFSGSRATGISACAGSARGRSGGFPPGLSVFPGRTSW
jgi:hypothetical protein